MKSRLTFGVVVAMILPFSGLSQSVVRFSNVPSEFATPADRYVYHGVVGGTLLTGNNFRAQLYATASPLGEMQPLGSPASFRTVPTTLPGTWIPADVVLAGGLFTPGMSITLQVRVWDSTYGSTFEAAGFGERGLSSPFTFAIPGIGPSPNTLEGLRAFAVAPEPAGFAFGGLALLTLLAWHLRRG